MKALVVPVLLTSLTAAVAVGILSERPAARSARPDGTTATVRLSRESLRDTPMPKAFPDDGKNSEQLQLEIERALVSIDDDQRERAYLQLLPRLIAIDPAAVQRLLENCPAGQVRDQLLRHTARAWSAADPDSAIEWVIAMTDDDERGIAAAEVVAQVAAEDPGRAIEASELLGTGGSDGSVEHIAQLWAMENLQASLRWVQAQPPGSQRDQLFARITTVQGQTSPADAASAALRQLGPGPLRDETVLSVLRRWSAQDADAAAAWVNDLPNGHIRELAETEVALLEQQRQ